MKKIAVICLTLFVIHSYAQDKNIPGKNQKHSSLKYNSILQAGVLEGESQSSFQVQMINGLQYKTWSTGIGIGIDNYKFRTIPLFVDFRKSILNKPSTPFVYADIGIQFPWVLDEQKNGYIESTFTHGFYYNLGAGYKINILKKNSLLFSTAFSFKQLTNDYPPWIPCDFGPCAEQDYTHHFKYTLRRLSLQIGWNF